MTPAVEQLVRQTMELTGETPPDLLRETAPILDAEALGDQGLYLVGLIGGKEVGKSAMVNALAGRQITAVTSHGPGTEGVIAYAHTSNEAALRELLQHQVPNEYVIVTHAIDALRNQALLDLPDIDSRFPSHLRITKAMLRHILYPIWIGSVEKYADLQPQQMLEQVAEGNDPANFLFCLNKVDQLSMDHAAADHPQPYDREPGRDLPEQSSPLTELRADYSARLQRALHLAEPPQVFLVSAINPSEFDLPALRLQLSRQQPAATVRQARIHAARRQDQSLIKWLDRQELPRRAQAAEEAYSQARQILAAGVAGPIMAEMIPKLLDDSGLRAAMTDDLLQERVARWPLVNLVHTLLAPLFLLLRTASAKSAVSLFSPSALIDAVAADCSHRPADLVQSSFSQLRATLPILADLYGHRRLWEPLGAQEAAKELRQSLAEILDHQRSLVRSRCGPWALGLGMPPRLLLTIGAALWFPFIQPVLQAALSGTAVDTPRRLAALLVAVLGVDYLLKSAGFLIIYFVVLWLALRWNTQRCIRRMLKKWKSADSRNESASLPAAVIAWTERLLAPLRNQHEHVRALTDRLAEELRNGEVVKPQLSHPPDGELAHSTG